VRNRRRTQEQKDIEESLSQHKALGAREMRDIIRVQGQSPSYFLPKDIYNDRQSIHHLQLGGFTPTQQWVNLLQQHGLRHFIRDDGKLEDQSRGFFLDLSLV
jgi:hypothetical protein